jgi:hypothetical protein
VPPKVVGAGEAGGHVNRRPIGTPDRHPKGTPRPTFRTISARAVGAGRGCGDGASEVCGLVVGSAFEAPAVIAGLDDVAVVGQQLPLRPATAVDVKAQERVFRTSVEFQPLLRGRFSPERFTTDPSFVPTLCVGLDPTDQSS